MNNFINKLHIENLNITHSGKVRDSFSLNNGTRLIFVSDRISAFDNILETPVPMKGAVLNKLTNFWFEKTRHIIRNHFIEEIDPNVTLVKEVTPIRVEMVVRGYLTGSMWRYYEQGKRNFSGVQVSDGLRKNYKFEHPIITPTTKEDSDREITPAEVVSTGLASETVFSKMRETALKLFDFGSKLLADKGILLVDTKYEFGVDEEGLILIDEIHTPDASRFWRAEDYAANPLTAEQIDKEFVRLWLIKNKINNEYPTALSPEIIEETTNRYLDIYTSVTGQVLSTEISFDIEKRIIANLMFHHFF